TKLSGGEFKRVILARAISQDTKILLLDEPVTALDIKHQINFMDLIKRLCIEKDLTVINVVHDLNLALFYSDEVIMLKKGRVFSKGLINEVLTADNIKSVYGVESTIIPHPIHNDKKVIVF
ncbi:MAG: ABC transporter ATP-binding protein, partial [Eubacteriales bacterium]